MYSLVRVIYMLRLPFSLKLIFFLFLPKKSLAPFHTQTLVSPYIYFTPPQPLNHLLIVSCLKRIISVVHNYYVVRSDYTEGGLFLHADTELHKNTAWSLKDASKHIFAAEFTFWGLTWGKWEEASADSSPAACISQLGFKSYLM